MLKYISATDINKLDAFSLDNAVKAVDTGFILLKNKQYILPNKIALSHKNYVSKVDRMMCMPAYAGGEINVWGVKWLGSKANNKSKGFSRSNALIILNNQEDCLPFAILEATDISLLRTVAVSIWTSEKIINAPKSIGCIGVGRLGLLHINKYLEKYKSISAVFMCSRNIDNLQKTKQSLELNYRNVIFNLENDPIDVVEKSEIIFCSTTGDCSVINHFITEEKKILIDISTRDIGINVFLHANNIFIDNFNQCNVKGKTIYQLIESNNYSQNDFNLIENMTSETNYKGLNIVYSSGLAIHDIVFAYHIFKEANRRHLGMVLPFFY